MELLSATDAIGPAFARTRAVLLGPDRKGSFLKLALIAALTQPWFFSMAFSYPMQGLQLALMTALHPHRSQQFAGGVAGIGVALVAIPLLIGLVVGIGIVYLFCRLRFVLFDLVLYRDGRVRPAWRKYGHPSARFFGLTLLVMLAFMLAGAVTLGPAFLHMVRTAMEMAREGQNANPLAMLGAMFPLMGGFLVAGILWAIVDSILQDFVLPPMALEDAAIEGALARVRNLFRNHGAQTVLYLLLRLVLGVGLSAVLMMVALLFVALAAGACFALGLLLFHSLWGHGLAATILFAALGTAMGLFILAFYLAAVISVFGMTGTFKQSYALYFYAGRYPALGDLLEPGATALTTPIEPLPPLSPIQDPPAMW